MEFQDLLSKRRSVRKFSDRPVEREVLERVVRMAITAPSSRNSHSTSFVVVTNPDIIKQLAGMRDYGSSFLKHAPAVILVAGNREKTDLVQVNSSISATVLHLAAVEMGLSSCWVHVEGRPQLKDQPDGAQAIDLVRELVALPDECDVLCALAVGYSEFEPAPIPEFDRDALITFVE